MDATKGEGTSARADEASEVPVPRTTTDPLLSAVQRLANASEASVHLLQSMHQTLRALLDRSDMAQGMALRQIESNDLILAEIRLLREEREGKEEEVAVKGKGKGKAKETVKGKGKGAK